MTSLRSSPAFSLVVLLTLGLFGLLGVLLLFPDLIGGIVGPSLAGHISQHFRQPHHRMHDLTFTFLLGTSALGMLAQLRAPTRNGAGQLMALISWGALLLVSTLTNSWVFAPLPLFAALTLLAATLHPTGRDLIRSVAVSRVNRVMLALVVIAAVPLITFAFGNVGLQQTAANDHAALGHYGFMSAFSLTAIGVGLLASFRPDGWRPTAWVAGALPALLGLASLLVPDGESDLSVIWAVAAISWGITFVVVAESVRLGDYALPNGAVGKSPGDPPSVAPTRVSRTRAWAYLSGLVFVALALLIAGLHLAGGGAGLHTPPSGVTEHGVPQR